MKRFALVALILFSTIAFAGDGRGNGGGVVVCDDGSIDLLDLWEGEALKGMKLTSATDGTAEAQALAGAEVLAKVGHAVMIPRVRELITRIAQHAETARDWFLPTGVAIEPPRDAQNLFIKRGCHLEGVALYDDESDQLDIDGQLYNRLSVSQRAALFVHEAVYKFLREKNGSPDSTFARHYTACLFSGGDCPELDPVAGVPTTGLRYDCRVTSGATRFFVFPVNSADGAQAKVWRIQLADANSWSALPARLYGDIAMSGVHLKGDSLFVDNFPDHDVAVQTHSSENRWRNIHHFMITMTRGPEHTLEVERGYQGNLYCK